jgi:hypothetical protein
MTAAPSGTPLILSVLSLVVSLVVGIGAVLMARANLQRQIQAAAREAWMREFRENVALLLTSENATRAAARQRIILLIAERDARQLPAENFFDALQRFLDASGDEKAADALTMAAAAILQHERYLIEVPRWLRWLERHGLRAFKVRRMVRRFGKYVERPDLP